ncbi:hypothetical protein BJ138DRAFT_1119906 [Hygrophoropsis aurantiaca]|uniref:Uncharacterized protein n=1 Tax=Hygrophoropsis aurantiaca TaxID=72124 RepID=A0ACB7ZTA1_9AGAM|nr:hypothetical protein BJ138DRAFT_1119906 [Hygrophoropsis aurantiaca]
MGRKPKYHSPEERLAASRAQKAQYAGSVRGRMKRKDSNAVAYMRSHGRRAAYNASPAIYAANRRLKSLPPALIALAATALPTSDIFYDALQGCTVLDESELIPWDYEPPYAMAEPPDIPDEALHTEKLVDILHGRRCRQERERRIDRINFLEQRVGQTSGVVKQREIRG